MEAASMPGLSVLGTRAAGGLATPQAAGSSSAGPQPGVMTGGCLTFAPAAMSAAAAGMLSPGTDSACRDHRRTVVRSLITVVA